mmetsp:Transcript_10544/g.20188  ORF Transcript_10544/g.20188 Transcript_10544/m.20188 type:complete len:82 (-) Transcript_10544:55-300(-)
MLTLSARPAHPDPHPPPNGSKKGPFCDNFFLQEGTEGAVDGLLANLDFLSDMGINVLDDAEFLSSVKVYLIDLIEFLSRLF